MIALKYCLGNPLSIRVRRMCCADLRRPDTLLTYLSSVYISLQPSLSRLRRLAPDPSFWRSGFDLRLLNVGLLVDKLVLNLAFLRFLPAHIISPSFQHSTLINSPIECTIWYHHLPASLYNTLKKESPMFLTVSIVNVELTATIT